MVSVDNIDENFSLNPCSINQSLGGLSRLDDNENKRQGKRIKLIANKYPLNQPNILPSQWSSQIIKQKKKKNVFLNQYSTSLLYMRKW